MAKKRESAAIRLRNRLETRGSPNFQRRRKYRDIGITGKPPKLSDPVVWYFTARSALTLGKGHRALKRAFETFDLDPNDPRDWPELAEELALIVFSEPKPAGRRRKWTWDRHSELIDAVARYRQSNPKRISDRRACELIVKAKDSPDYFREVGIKGLLRQLLFARAQRKADALPKAGRTKKA